MRAYWFELRKLFGNLAYLIKNCDPDGVELYFMISEQKEKSKNTRLLSQTLERKGSFLHGDSNAAKRIASLLQDYQQKLGDHGSLRTLWRRGPPRPVNLYIFTDGVWQPDCDVATPIRYLVDELEDKRLPADQFGIQFIQFGNDSTGTDRLNHLDAGLNLKRFVLSFQFSIQCFISCSADNFLASQGHSGYRAVKRECLENAARFH
jgi:hypothetical protein